MPMLKEVNHKVLTKVLEFSERDIFGASISTLITAYGLDTRFLQFLYSQNDENKITSLIAIYEGKMQICANDKADFSEFTQFYLMSYAKSLFCEYTTAKKMELEGFNTNLVMKHIDCQKAISLDLPKIVSREKLMPVYDIIFGKEFKKNNPNAFEEWYTDISHKVRHSKARIMAIYNGETPVSVALTVAESLTKAVIGSVATLHEYRNRGYASALVLALTKELKNEGKEVFLCPKNDALKAFYENIGFVDFSKSAFHIKKDDYI